MGRTWPGESRLCQWTSKWKGSCPQSYASETLSVRAFVLGFVNIYISNYYEGTTAIPHEWITLNVPKSMIQAVKREEIPDLRLHSNPLKTIRTLGEFIRTMAHRHMERALLGKGDWRKKKQTKWIQEVPSLSSRKERDCGKTRRKVVGPEARNWD